MWGGFFLTDLLEALFRKWEAELLITHSDTVIADQLHFLQDTLPQLIGGSRRDADDILETRGRRGYLVVVNHLHGCGDLFAMGSCSIGSISIAA